MEGKKAYRRIVVKIGSNVLTGGDGALNIQMIRQLARQISGLRSGGLEVIVVSSGAVAAGRGAVPLTPNADAVVARQVLSAIGQVRLMQAWSGCFADDGAQVAQVLVTKEDFRDRQHYLHMQACFLALIAQQVIPVVNENDVIAVTELMFTDNDELAGLIAAMLNADALVILTNVEGIYDGDPKDGGSRVITRITPGDHGVPSAISSERSAFGRGGMLTKYRVAGKAAKLGVQVHIANGRKKGVLEKILAGELVHSHFIAEKRLSAKKKWIAQAEQACSGQVTINPGAVAALSGERAASLLPVGLVRIDKPFLKGDIIRIADESGAMIGYGLAEYSSEVAGGKAGKKNQRLLVHYDYLYLSS